MSSEYSQREDILSGNDEIIISQDFPIIQTDTESSSFNRLGKFVSKIGQNEWISEMDLFATPMKLNYNGQDTFKTEFGGLMFLNVAVVCIIMTVLFQFPNGVTLNRPITFYSLAEQIDPAPLLFEHTDELFYVYLYNKVTKMEANTAEYTFLFKKMSAINIKNGVNTILDISTNCSKGIACLKKTALNEHIKIQTITGLTETLQIEIATCGLMAMDPVFGDCLTFKSSFDVIIAWTGFTEETGQIVPQTRYIVPRLSNQVIKVDTNSFTTNNIFLGHIANVLSYPITYYQPYDSIQVAAVINQDTSLNCFSFLTFTGNTCNIVSMISSEQVNHYTQDFDDITTLILFFVSLIETLFFLVYFACIKNYNNNAFHLRIADSVVYHEDRHHKHYNFKSGASVFFACLVHNNPFTNLVDLVLFKVCQTQIKRILTIKAQMTIRMIDFGEKCIGEQMVFDEINRVYQQQNLQPTKIVFEDPDEKDEEVSQKDPKIGEKDENHDVDQDYFKNQLDEEAFSRMCKDQEFYTISRKKYLRDLLKRTDKSFKLVLQVQTIFEHYRNIVRDEHCTKPAELPVGFTNEEQSAMEIRKSNP